MSKLNPQLQQLLSQAQQSDCTRQRQALASLGYRAQLAGTTPMAALEAYFFELFRSSTPPPEPAVPGQARLDPIVSFHSVVPGTIPAGVPAPEPAAPTELSIRCSSCGKSFASQTALNGHGEARCAKRTAPQSVLSSHA